MKSILIFKKKKTLLKRSKKTLFPSAFPSLYPKKNLEGKNINITAINKVEELGTVVAAPQESYHTCITYNSSPELTNFYRF